MPSFTSGNASISRDENALLNFVIAATDPDIDGDATLSFSLSGPDANEFKVTNDGPTATVEYAANSNISDAEDGDNKLVYNFTVTVTDTFVGAQSLTDTIDIINC